MIHTGRSALPGAPTRCPRFPTLAADVSPGRLHHLWLRQMAQRAGRRSPAASGGAAQCFLRRNESESVSRPCPRLRSDRPIRTEDRAASRTASAASFSPTRPSNSSGATRTIGRSLRIARSLRRTIHGPPRRRIRRCTTPLRCRSRPTFCPAIPSTMANSASAMSCSRPFPGRLRIPRKQLCDYYGMIRAARMRRSRPASSRAAHDSGRAENTIVLYTGDPRPGPSARTGLFGKQNVYEHSVGVPLIVHGPQIPPRPVRRLRLRHGHSPHALPSHRSLSAGQSGGPAAGRHHRWQHRQCPKLHVSRLHASPTTKTITVAPAPSTRSTNFRPVEIHPLPRPRQNNRPAF